MTSLLLALALSISTQQASVSQGYQVLDSLKHTDVSNENTIAMLTNVKSVMSFTVKDSFEQVYVKHSTLSKYNYDSVLINDKAQNHKCINYYMRLIENNVVVAFACDCESKRCIVINEKEYIDLLKSLLILEQK